MKKANKKEIFRFIICGLVAAIIDYVTCQLVILALPNSLKPTLITTISSIVGFLVSVVINYLLSTNWVFKNVSKEVKTSSTSFKLLFLLFSLIGMVLSIGTMLLCERICLSVLSINIVEASFVSLIKDNGLKFLINSVFWAYAISFVLKTFVGLVFNFLTRKYILFKEA